jgi:hypothetical protein
MYQRAADVMTVDEVPCLIAGREGPVHRPARRVADVPEYLTVKPWPVCGDDPRHGYPQPMYVGVLSAELFTQLPVVSVL